MRDGIKAMLDTAPRNYVKCVRSVQQRDTVLRYIRISPTIGSLLAVWRPCHFYIGAARALDRARQIAPTAKRGRSRAICACEREPDMRSRRSRAQKKMCVFTCVVLVEFRVGSMLAYTHARVHIYAAKRGEKERRQVIEREKCVRS